MHTSIRTHTNMQAYIHTNTQADKYTQTKCILPGIHAYIHTDRPTESNRGIK